MIWNLSVAYIRKRQEKDSRHTEGASSALETGTFAVSPVGGVSQPWGDVLGKDMTHRHHTGLEKLYLRDGDVRH